MERYLMIQIEWLMGKYIDLYMHISTYTHYFLSFLFFIITLLLHLHAFLPSLLYYSSSTFFPWVIYDVWYFNTLKCDTLNPLVSLLPWTTTTFVWWRPAESANTFVLGLSGHVTTAPLCLLLLIHVSSFEGETSKPSVCLELFDDDR